MGVPVSQAPKFAKYPLSQAPVYSRWWTSFAVLSAAVLISGKLVFSDFYELRIIVIVALGVLCLWLLAFLVRVLCFRLDQHNAYCYGVNTQQLEQAWWSRHRQTVALVESVLLGAVCRSAEQKHALFSPDLTKPTPEQTDDGWAIRVPQVFGKDVAEREAQLAALLALQWQQQRSDLPVEQPLRCYWQGTPAAWNSFAEQVKKLWPTAQFPERPDVWQGIDSLDAIVDQLHEEPAEAWILCAGCQSSPIQRESRLPAGEAAVLWVLGKQEGVRIARGEWLNADVESLAAVAERALRQSELEASGPPCVSFSQPDLPDVSAIGWNLRQHLQDANFGALGNLESMVVLTLAAWYAEGNSKACAWLANDPQHTLAIGVVKPDDSTN